MSRVKQEMEKEQQTAPGKAAAMTQADGNMVEPGDEKAAAAMTHAEYEALERTIDYHMDRYYNQDAPEISDYEYDQLMLRLKAAERAHPEWITPDSPTQKIGGTAKREAGVKVTHDVPMLSIEDVFTREDVAAFIGKVHEVHPSAKFSVEQKIDGLSMSLRYRRNPETGQLSLVLAETRGDGLIGEDVTANARVIPDVKQTINLPFDSLELRGEVYMTHADFDRFNEEQENAGKKAAANPRNLAAGSSIPRSPGSGGSACSSSTYRRDRPISWRVMTPHSTGSRSSVCRWPGTAAAQPQRSAWLRSTRSENRGGALTTISTARW